MLRLDVGLCWVNAAEVQDAILDVVRSATATKAVVLDLECTDRLETTSADMVSTLRDLLAERGVDLYFVRLRWPVRTVLARSGLRARVGEDHIWHSIPQGVREARRQHGLSGTAPSGPRSSLSLSALIWPSPAGSKQGRLKRGTAHQCVVGVALPY